MAAVNISNSERFPMDFATATEQTTTIDASDRLLLAAMQGGLPLNSRPYSTLGEQLNLSESEVISRLARLKQQGLIKRLGIVVKHRQLGYQANAMIVWDIPDADVKVIGARISAFAFVNLCYRRPRHGLQWPYNLYCMIHGKNRETVLAQLQELTDTCALSGYSRQILFSRRCFKQRGAVYQPPPAGNNTDG